VSQPERRESTSRALRRHPRRADLAWRKQYEEHREQEAEARRQRVRRRLVAIVGGLLFRHRARGLRRWACTSGRPRVTGRTRGPGFRRAPSLWSRARPAPELVPAARGVDERDAAGRRSAAEGARRLADARRARRARRTTPASTSARTGSSSSPPATALVRSTTGQLVATHRAGSSSTRALQLDGRSVVTSRRRGATRFGVRAARSFRGRHLPGLARAAFSADDRFSSRAANRLA
jgi:hypothetical protein